MTSPSPQRFVSHCTELCGGSWAQQTFKDGSRAPVTLLPGRKHGLNFLRYRVAVSGAEAAAFATICRAGVLPPAHQLAWTPTHRCRANLSLNRTC